MLAAEMLAVAMYWDFWQLKSCHKDNLQSSKYQDRKKPV